MADEEKASVVATPSEPVDIVIEHRLASLGFHLNEGLLAGCRLLQDQIDVLLGPTDARYALPAGASEDEVH